MLERFTAQTATESLQTLIFVILLSFVLSTLLAYVYQKTYRGLSYSVGKQTKQEAVEAYCNKNGFDPERFMNGEYGRVIVIERELVKPREIKNDD